MKKITLDVPENKFRFFMELVTNLGLRATLHNPEKLTPSQKEFVKDLQQALNESNLHLKGKIKLKSAQDFVNEN